MGEEKGIYVYGFGRAADAADLRLQDFPEVYQIESEPLTAYCRDVDLADYSEAALKERADDQAWLLVEAQRHHSVIAAIHQQAPILPAKFGSAYATEADVREAISRADQPMLDRLNVLAGCDEWAAHVYLEIDDLTPIVVEADPELKELAAELESASEGRKYMLRQQVQTRMQNALEHYEMQLADRALNALRPLVVDFQSEPPRDPESVPDGEHEISRASMLIRRETAEEFIELAEETNRAMPEIWLQITGPWPAYSFAQIASEDEVIRYG